MIEQLARLTVSIEPGFDADAEELVTSAMRLRDWLLELDIDSAEVTTAGQSLPGTRSDGMLVAGVLTVILNQSPELFTKLIDTVRAWLPSSGTRSVKLEIDGDALEVTGITREDQRELIRLWIDRHTDR